MNVRSLIERLQELDPDLRVEFEDDQGHYMYDVEFLSRTNEANGTIILSGELGRPV